MLLKRTIVMLVLVTCVFSHGEECSSNKDCASNECCKSTAQVRGKRSAAGICTRKGRQEDICYDNSGLTHIGGLRLDCTCDVGYRCRVTGGRLHPKGRIGYCERIPSGGGGPKDPV